MANIVITNSNLEMTNEEFYKILQFISRTPQEKINIVGINSDPLSHKNIINYLVSLLDYLNSFQNSDFKINIFTPGYNLLLLANQAPDIINNTKFHFNITYNETSLKNFDKINDGLKALINLRGTNELSLNYLLSSKPIDNSKFWDIILKYNINNITLYSEIYLKTPLLSFLLEALLHKILVKYKGLCTFNDFKDTELRLLSCTCINKLSNKKDTKLYIHKDLKVSDNINDTDFNVSLDSFFNILLIYNYYFYKRNF